jgi:hypothetical protein
VLALLAAVVLTPLLYLPGFLLARALLGAAQPPDLLERHYERVVVGALLNGWLALTLAELGVFSAWLHVLLLLAICAGCAVIALRRGALRLPGAPLGIVAHARPTFQKLRTKNREPRTDTTQHATRNTQHATHWWSVVVAHWEVVAFAIVGLLFAILIARPFEVVLGVRDAGVYANIGFAIVRTGGIVQHDELVAQIGRDQSSDDPELRIAAEQAETNFLGVQHPDRTIATRLRAAGFYINAGELESGRVVPQFFHLYSAWIGLLAALLGLRGGLLATGLLGFLGVWGVGMLGRRLAGRWVGLLAMLFLALNGVQVWFSRYSTSEATVQFLTFAGLYAFAVMTTDDRPFAAAQGRRRPTEDLGTENQEPRHGDKKTRRQGADQSLGLLVSVSLGLRVSSVVGGRRGFAALLAGLAFGQVALTRVDFALVIVPVAAYLFYIWLTHRWSRTHTLLASGILAMLLHAALHVVFIARAYFFDTLFARLQDYALVALFSMPFLTPELRQAYLTRPETVIGSPGAGDWNVWRVGLELVVLVSFVVGVLALRRWGLPAIRVGERVVHRWTQPLLLLSALGIVMLAAYAYLIRPRILTPQVLAALPICLSPVQIMRPTGACLTIQGYIGAPIAVPGDLRDLYAIPLANLVRIGWYLSPLGVVLGVAGFALWWRRGMHRASWLFLTIALIGAIFFVRQTYGSSGQTYIYILRRYVPQVYPAFCLGIAYVLVRIAAWRREQFQTAHLKSKIGLTIAGVFGLALVSFLIATDLPIYRHVEYSGALAQIESIAGRFRPRDVLLLHSGNRDEPDLVATPLRFAFGVNAFTIKSTQPERYAPQLARYIRRWQEQGRTVYMIFGASGGFGLPGLRYMPVDRMALQHLEEFEQLTDQKPHNIQDFNLDFAVYRVEADATASAAPAAIAVDDYAAQLRGFYRPERIAGVDLVWTQGDALLRLPWSRDSRPQKVAIRLAGGVRPESVGPGQACISFRPEMPFGFEGPLATFSPLGCFDLQEQMSDYVLTIDPRRYSTHGPGAIVLRIRSDTWTPTKADPTQLDRRALGVQFGGLTISPP